MLYITFQPSKQMIWNVQGYFNFNYQDEWLDDPMVKEMILDVDKSHVLAQQLIQSPVLGLIPPERLSGGVKALIMLLKQPELLIWATACGDNCAKWIVKISEMQDITIVLEHIMWFPDDFRAVCLDNGRQIYNLFDYRGCVLDCLKLD